MFELSANSSTASKLGVALKLVLSRVRDRDFLGAGGEAVLLGC